MSTTERPFKGNYVPAEIWLNTELNWTEKMLLVEIDALDKDDEIGCYATNKYLSKFLLISEGQTANIISSLKKRGFLIQTFFDGKVRGLRSSFNKTFTVKENLEPYNEEGELVQEVLKDASGTPEHIYISDNKNASLREGFSKQKPREVSENEDLGRSFWKQLLYAMEESGYDASEARPMIGRLFRKYDKDFVYAIFFENEKLILDASNPYPYLIKILEEEKNKTPEDREIERALRDAENEYKQITASSFTTPSKFDPKKFVHRYPILQKFIDREEAKLKTLIDADPDYIAKQEAKEAEALDAQGLIKYHNIVMSKEEAIYRMGQNHDYKQMTALELKMGKTPSLLKYKHITTLEELDAAEEIK